MIFPSKHYIYLLINQYLNKEINEPDFCDEFYKAYDLGEVEDDYSNEEEIALSNLSEVAGRFSEFENDHKNYPGVYYTKEELAAKILETKEQLMKIHPEYFE